MSQFWPKYWSFSFNISPSNEYSWLISSMIDWSDLLAVQGTLESSITPLFKRINSSALSLLYGPTLTSIHDYWKSIALTIWIFAGKVMSLLYAVWVCHSFSSKEQAGRISWLQSLSAVNLELRKIVCHCFPCVPIYFPWSDGKTTRSSFPECCFKPAFSLSPFTFIKRLFKYSSLSAIKVSSSYLRGYWYLSWQSWCWCMLPSLAFCMM